MRIQKQQDAVNSDPCQSIRWARRGEAGDECKALKHIYRGRCPGSLPKGMLLQQDMTDAILYAGSGCMLPFAFMAVVFVILCFVLFQSIVLILFVALTALVFAFCCNVTFGQGQTLKISLICSSNFDG